MAEFLVEVFMANAESPTAPRPADISKVAAELTREGSRVRLVRSILVPEDETCLYLFRAETGEAVREAATRAGLQFEHVVAVAPGWREPRPAVRDGPGHPGTKDKPSIQPKSE